jgi:hypothetical protein
LGLHGRFQIIRENRFLDDPGMFLGLDQCRRGHVQGMPVRGKQSKEEKCKEKWAAQEANHSVKVAGIRDM